MRDGASKLLARGGRALGVAAIAHARGQRAGKGPWHALSREIAAAAEQVLGALEEDVSQRALGAAVGAAMGEAPATSEPAWARALIGDPDAFARIGRGAEAAWPPDFPVEKPAGERERGVAITALALCRSVDAARALAIRLPRSDGDALVRWARLLQALARPGEPSTVREAVRRALAEEANDGVRDQGL
jgi:hypothetical protein